MGAATGIFRHTRRDRLVLYGNTNNFFFAVKGQNHGNEGQEMAKS